MDLSGRFNFWRILLHTRAITPPRVPAGHWPGSVFLRRGGWSVLLLVAVLAAAVTYASVSVSCSFSPLRQLASDQRSVGSGATCSALVMNFARVSDSTPMEYRAVRPMARVLALDHETADAAIAYAI